MGGCGCGGRRVVRGVEAAVIRIRRVRGLGLNYSMTSLTSAAHGYSVAPALRTLLREQSSLMPTVNPAGQGPNEQDLASMFQDQAGGGSLPQSADPTANDTPPTDQGVVYTHPDGTPVLAATSAPQGGPVTGPVPESSKWDFWRMWAPPIAVVGGIGFLIWILRRKKRRR